MLRMMICFGIFPRKWCLRSERPPAADHYCRRKEREDTQAGCSGRTQPPWRLHQPWNKGTTTETPQRKKKKHLLRGSVGAPRAARLCVLISPSALNPYIVNFLLN